MLRYPPEYTHGAGHYYYYLVIIRISSEPFRLLLGYFALICEQFANVETQQSCVLDCTYITTHQW